MTAAPPPTNSCSRLPREQRAAHHAGAAGAQRCRRVQQPLGGRGGEASRAESTFMGSDRLYKYHEAHCTLVCTSLGPFPYSTIGAASDPH